MFLGRNFLHFYLSPNIIAVAVTVYLIYLFIYFVYLLYHFFIFLSIKTFFIKLYNPLKQKL